MTGSAWKLEPKLFQQVLRRHALALQPGLVLNSHEVGEGSDLENGASLSFERLKVAQHCHWSQLVLHLCGCLLFLNHHVQ